MKLSRQIKVNSYKLLEILQSHAPTGKEQEICVTFYNNTPEEYRERMMATALTDGLLYGNWPWTHNGLSIDR